MDDILSLCANEAAVNRIRAHRQRVAKLLDRGVTCLSPETLEIGEDVDLAQIHPTVTLHAGTRIQGPRTVLGPNVELGREAPVTVSNCVLGPNVVPPYILAPILITELFNAAKGPRTMLPSRILTCLPI